MKATPKSCGCRHCKAVKGKAGGKHDMRISERRFRHNANTMTKLGRDEDVAPATHGERVG